MLAAGGVANDEWVHRTVAQVAAQVALHNALQYCATHASSSTPQCMSSSLYVHADYMSYKVPSTQLVSV